MGESWNHEMLVEYDSVCLLMNWVIVKGLVVVVGLVIKRVDSYKMVGFSE